MAAITIIPTAAESAARAEADRRARMDARLAATATIATRDDALAEIHRLSMVLIAATHAEYTARHPMKVIASRRNRASRPATIARIDAEMADAMAAHAAAMDAWKKANAAHRAASDADAIAMRAIADCGGMDTYAAAYAAAHAVLMADARDTGPAYDAACIAAYAVRDAALDAADEAVSARATPDGWACAGGPTDDDSAAHATQPEGHSDTIDPAGIIPPAADDAGSDMPAHTLPSARAMMRAAIAAHDAACEARDAWANASQMAADGGNPEEEGYADDAAIAWAYAASEIRDAIAAIDAIPPVRYSMDARPAMAARDAVSHWAIAYEAYRAAYQYGQFPG